MTCLPPAQEGWAGLGTGWAGLGTGWAGMGTGRSLEELVLQCPSLLWEQPVDCNAHSTCER